MFVLCCAAAVGLSVSWWFLGPAWLGQEPSVIDSPAPSWANKVDPNEASESALACLPGVGEVRARDIVAYRRAWRGAGPAFQSPSDLARVKGMGEKTVARISPFLVFAAPTSAPASGPARPQD